MKASITFEKEIEKVPDACKECPFVDACDTMIHGITKRGGLELTIVAMKRRVKECPLKVGEQ